MILRDRYWVLSLVSVLTVIKTTKNVVHLFTTHLSATVRLGLRYGYYTVGSLVFFSPDPRFKAGECVIVCLSFIYYEYAEMDSAVVNYSKDLTNYKGPNHGDF